MEDKELFEKVEKTFSLNKNTNKINEVFDNGNFKKALNEVVTSKAPSVPNTGGFFSALGSGLGKVARSIPGTRGHKMRTAQMKQAQAEAQKAQAQARLAGIQAAKAQSDLLGGDEKPQGKIEVDEFTEAEFKRNPQFKNAFTKASKDKNLTATETDVYRQGMAKAERARKAAKKDVIAGQEQQAQIDAQKSYDAVSAKAPTIISKLSDNDKKKLFKFIRNKEGDKLTDKEIKDLGTNLTKQVSDTRTKNELTQLRSGIGSQGSLKGSPEMVTKFQASTPVPKTIKQQANVTTAPVTKKVVQSTKKERSIEQKRLGNEKMTANEFKDLQRKTAGNFRPNDVVEIDGKEGKFVKYTVKQGKATVRVPAKTKTGYKDIEVYPTKLKKSQQQELGGIDNGAASKTKPKRKQKSVDEIGKEAQKIIDKQPKVPDSAVFDHDERQGDKEERLKRQSNKKKENVKKKELKPLKSLKDIDKETEKDLAKKFATYRPYTGKVKRPPLI